MSFSNSMSTNKKQAKVHFFPLIFKILQFWFPKYKNHNVDPLRFSLIAYFILLVYFDPVHVDMAHAVRPRRYILFFYLFFQPRRKLLEFRKKKKNMLRVWHVRASTVIYQGLKSPNFFPKIHCSSIVLLAFFFLSSIGSFFLVPSFLLLLLSIYSFLLLFLVSISLLSFPFEFQFIIFSSSFDFAEKNG